jgi:hypothetical protein
VEAIVLQRLGMRGLAGACVVAVSLTACSNDGLSEDPWFLSEAARPTRAVARTYYAEFTDGVQTHTASWDQEVEVSRFAPPAEQGPPSDSPQARRMSLDLERDILALAWDARVDRTVSVVITFREDRELPTFPEPDVNLPRSAAFNAAARAEGESMGP